MISARDAAEGANMNTPLPARPVPPLGIVGNTVTGGPALADFLAHETALRSSCVLNGGAGLRVLIRAAATFEVCSTS
jgi:hypothetical protein